MAKEKDYERHQGSMYSYADGTEVFVPWGEKNDGEPREPQSVTLVQIGKSKVLATKNTVRLVVTLDHIPFDDVCVTFIRQTQRLINQLNSMRTPSKKLYDAIAKGGECASLIENGKLNPEGLGVAKIENWAGAEKFDPEYDKFG